MMEGHINDLAVEVHRFPMKMHCCEACGVLDKLLKAMALCVLQLSSCWRWSSSS